MRHLVRPMTALVLFAASFAFVEAAVAEYLRFVWQPIHIELFPGVPADSIFPIIRLDQLEAAGPEHLRILGTELAREAATMLMLATVALAIARNFRQWFAGFMVAFGVWDIFFYIFLKVLLDWPHSLATWDLLFLLPVPWVGPVWAPVVVSLAMIGAGAVLLVRETAGRPVAFRWIHIFGIGAGGLIVIVAFCWDWRNIMAARDPSSFNWQLFSIGMAVGLGSFVHAVAEPRKRTYD
jgi:hypothetical protein